MRAMHFVRQARVRRCTSLSWLYSSKKYISYIQLFTSFSSLSDLTSIWLSSKQICLIFKQQQVETKGRIETTLYSENECVWRVCSTKLTSWNDELKLSFIFNSVLAVQFTYVCIHVYSMYMLIMLLKKVN